LTITAAAAVLLFADEADEAIDWQQVVHILAGQVLGEDRLEWTLAGKSLAELIALNEHLLIMWVSHVEWRLEVLHVLVIVTRLVELTGDVLGPELRGHQVLLGTVARRLLLTVRRGRRR